MKKILFVLCVLFCALSFSACGNNPVAERYYLDENGDLIAVYTDDTTENLGNFGDEAVESIKSIAISEDGYYILNGIKTDIVAVQMYEVKFDSGFSAAVSSQIVKDGYKVERPELERTGYTLNGWYCNGEEWRFNSDVVKSDMQLTAVWTANEYEVSFAPGTGEVVDPITVVFDQAYALPQPERTGHTFNGWFWQDELVTGDKWGIAADCMLTASWTANKYTVTLNANGGEVPETELQVEFGKRFTLPVATNEYGAFIGWFYQEEQITDSLGNSLGEWTYTSDIEVTTSWIIELSSAEDLQQLYAYPNGHFVLTDDIELPEGDWTPVGTAAEPFTGQIDGNHFTIAGLTITQLRPNQRYYGFIGFASSGKIFNLSFTNIHIALPAVSNTVYVGGVAGYNKDATFENVSVSGSINLANHSSAYSSYAGGIIGYSQSDSVRGCTNRADIEAGTAAGGMIGYKEMSAITLFENNVNYGEIRAQIAGGMMGDGILFLASKCFNMGDIYGERHAGGIVGRSYYMVIIDQCSNKGNITSYSTSPAQSDSAGGIIGSLEMHPDYFEALGIASYIQNCFNQGEISSSKNAGGIIGFGNQPIVNSVIHITSCYNSGKIAGNYYAGGIGGCLTAFEISQCANFGEISSSGVSAVLCYILLYPSSIQNCYYNCSTTGLDSVQGTHTDETYSNVFYTDLMFWDQELWVFYEDGFPTLKAERT